MREMYQNEAEMSPSSPDVSQDKQAGLDPFYDRLAPSYSYVSQDKQD